MFTEIVSLTSFDIKGFFGFEVPLSLYRIYKREFGNSSLQFQKSAWQETKRMGRKNKKSKVVFIDVDGPNKHGMLSAAVVSQTGQKIFKGSTVVEFDKSLLLLKLRALSKWRRSWKRRRLAISLEGTMFSATWTGADNTFYCLEMSVCCISKFIS